LIEMRLFIMSMLAAGAAAADQTAWLIGGGAGIDSAQSQIESNVRWLEELLLERGIDVNTYFALGDEPGKDVAYWDAAAREASDSTLEPLARIFATPVEAHLAFRRHDLQTLRGPTLKNDLVRALTADLESHTAGDDVLVVYNGHGGLDEDDVSRNYLRLWGEQRLHVEELDAMLDALPEDTTTRFVMTQCYSGAFHSLVYEDPLDPERLEGGRCGFMSESALELAEGCGLGVDEDEYRDYSTYFFAALSAETRLGEPIDERVVDRDGDGRASFREAHLYALATAHSADLPRATSEEYLTLWTPWYLQWDAAIDGHSSIYWTIAEEVATRYSWSPSPDALEARRGEFLGAQGRAREEQRGAHARELVLQAALMDALLTRWPELGYPYSAAYHELIETQWPAIERHVREDSRYAALVDVQTRIAGLKRELADTNRHLTQIDKIYRLRNLARLETAMGIFGSRDEQSDYASLVECESGSID
jgi:hypothetical protein